MHEYSVTLRTMSGSTRTLVVRADTEAQAMSAARDRYDGRIVSVTMTA